MKMTKKKREEIIRIARENGARSVTIEGVVIEFGDNAVKPDPVKTTRELVDDIFADGILKQEISDEDMLFWSVPLPEEAHAVEIDADKVDTQ